MQETFGPIRQIAFVTRHMERSMEFYTRDLGIGPWFSTNRAWSEGFQGVRGHQ
jgi:hypothetical protein